MLDILAITFRVTMTAIGVTCSIISILFLYLMYFDPETLQTAAENLHAFIYNAHQIIVDRSITINF